MKGKTTLFLLLIAVVLASYLYFFERKSLTTEEKEERKGRIFSFGQEEIEKIRITTSGEELVVAKKDNGWEISSPVKAEADSAGVEMLLHNITDLKTSRIILPEKGKEISWADYGLSDPAVQVRFQRKGREPEEGFLLGKKSAFGDHLYARPLDKKELWILPGVEMEDFNKTSSDLRNRRITEVDQNRITVLEFHYADQDRKGMVFTREKGNHWLMRTPYVSKADETVINSLLTGIGNLRAMSFVTEKAEDFSAYGLDRPEIHVVFREGETSRALDFGKTAGETEEPACYCKLEGVDTVYTVAVAEKERFFKTPEDMQNKNITDFKTENVGALELQYPDLLIRCEKDEKDDWWMRAPRSCRCDHWTVDQYVSMVSALRTKRFLSLPPGAEKKFGLEPPRLAISLDVKGRPKPVVVKLGNDAPDGEGIYTSTSQGNRLYLVETDTMKNLSKGVFDFRLKEVFNFLLDDLEGLEIEREGKIFRFEKEKESWKMLSPVKRTLEQTRMSDLTDKFSYLEMSGIPGETPKLSSAGLSPPKLKIGIRLKDEKEMKRLWIGNRLETEEKGEQRYAMMEGQDEVFFIEPFVYDGVIKTLKNLEQNASE